MSADPFADLVARIADMHAKALEADAQIRDLLEEREELLTEIRRLRMGNHPAGRALPHLALAEALTERDAEHEGHSCINGGEPWCAVCHPGGSA